MQLSAAMSTARQRADSFAGHLVIGGGPAGSMLALRLAAAGRDVTLIEREPAAHNKVCGEFLSREAVQYLYRAGVDPLGLGAHTIQNVRLSSGNRMVCSSLPFEALSLSRRALDEALLARAAQSCKMLRGVAVESVAMEGETWTVQLNNGCSLHCTSLFLATGKHDLRGYSRPAGRQNDLVGFKMHFALAPAKIDALRQAMELYLFPGGYGGLSLIEDDAANLCVVVRRSALCNLGSWPQLFEFILESNCRLRWLLDGAAPAATRPLAISPIPYGYLATEYDGIWRVGDQAAVIPSFTGDGMSIALHSASLAAAMFLAGKSAAEYASLLRAQLRRQMSLATWLSRVAVTRGGRVAALAVVPLVPALLRWIANCTRIPSSSLLVAAEPKGCGDPQEMRS